MRRLHDGLVLGDRYALVRRIASGGMGDVWEARDSVLERSVAVKVMRADPNDEESFRTRFRAEARYAARLSHPNIAAVHDYGEYDNLSFLVMELVPGRSLAQLLREEGPIDPLRVRSIMGQAALALSAAHAAGVVHRDVKPANVLLTEDGTVKLADFGIARAVGALSQTRTGEVLGTPYYLSPELTLGRTATGASDIYSLGVVAHEMLTGNRPFDRETPVATALAHLEDPPPALPDSVPADLAEVIARCLEKDPAGRPATASSVAVRLGLVAEPGPTPLAATVLGSAAQEELPSPAAHSDPVPSAAPTASFPSGTTGVITPLHDLEEILAHLAPQLNEGTYVVVSVLDPPPTLRPVLTLQEPEGLTMMVRQEEADALGLAYELPLAWITLGAYRAIGSVGLVASATSALAQAQIAAVAGVGRWHTHLYVPKEAEDRAMKVLTRLSRAHRD